MVNLGIVRAVKRFRKTMFVQPTYGCNGFPNHWFIEAADSFPKPASLTPGRHRPRSSLVKAPLLHLVCIAPMGTSTKLRLRRRYRGRQVPWGSYAIKAGNAMGIRLRKSPAASAMNRSRLKPLFEWSSRIANRCCPLTSPRRLKPVDRRVLNGHHCALKAEIRGSGMRRILRDLPELRALIAANLRLPASSRRSLLT